MVGSTLPGRAFSYLSFDQLQPRRRAGLFFVAFMGSSSRPSDGKIVPLDGKQMAVPRFSTRPPGRTATDHLDAMCLYAGQGVGGLKRVMPAREIVEEMVTEAENLLPRPH